MNCTVNRSFNKAVRAQVAAPKRRGNLKVSAHPLAALARCRFASKSRVRECRAGSTLQLDTAWDSARMKCLRACAVSSHHFDIC